MEFGRIFYFVPVFEVLKDDGLDGIEVFMLPEC
jgi:hypothetical protein